MTKFTKMTKEDKYINVMFPYPSGSGLHIGHTYNYAITDSYCRYWRYKGHNVFQPFGFDSFGLPAENYAKKVGRKPSEVTYENIDNFRRQMKDMNTGYVDLLTTSDVSYYKWTQWLFSQLLEKGLAYKKDGEVNWCSSCETVLAREQVKDGKCERCSTKIEMKTMNQWYFKITDYTDRLIKNLDHLDYPKATINAQRNWLANQHDWCVSRQRSWGCPIPVDGETDTLDTFVDSSFYYVRYCDPTNEDELCSKEKYKQIDVYVGGSEHACMHLIYTRFIHMFLYDIGVVPVEEPFKKVIHNGMVIGSDGQKMSKSSGNAVNPDDYHPTILRFHLMFMGHFFDGGKWDPKSINGIIKFVNRFKIWMNMEGSESIDIEPFKSKVFNYTESFKFNKVVSEFMILLKNNKSKYLSPDCKKDIIDILEIYIPDIRTLITE